MYSTLKSLCLEAILKAKPLIKSYIVKQITVFNSEFIRFIPKRSVTIIFKILIFSESPCARIHIKIKNILMLWCKLFLMFNDVGYLTMQDCSCIVDDLLHTYPWQIKKSAKRVRNVRSFFIVMCEPCQFEHRIFAEKQKEVNLRV